MLFPFASIFFVKQTLGFRNQDRKQWYTAKKEIGKKNIKTVSWRCEYKPAKWRWVKTLPQTNGGDEKGKQNMEVCCVAQIWLSIWCKKTIKAVRGLLCLPSRTFHASHVSAPGPVLSRCHGGDIVLRVCVHGLTHQGAVHVDRVVTTNKIPVSD